MEDAPEWLLEKMSTENVEKLCNIAVILWGIWFFRNKKVWENRVVSSKFVVDWSLKQITDWRIANDKVLQSRSIGKSSRRTENTKWVAPEEGSLNLNVDASLTQGVSSFTVGCVLRDRAGDFKGGR